MVEIKRTSAGQSFTNKRIGVVNTREDKVSAYQAQANAFFQISQSGLRLAAQLGRSEAKEYAMGAPLEARDENGVLLPASLPENTFFGKAGREDAKKIFDERYLAKWKVDTSKAFNDFAKAKPNDPNAFKIFSGDLLSQTQAVLKEQGDEVLADIVGAQGYGLASEYTLKMENNLVALENAEALATAKDHYNMIAGDIAQRFANGEMSIEEVNSFASDISRNAEGIFGASPRYAQDLENTVKRSAFERKMEISFRGKSEAEINTAILDLRTNKTDSKIAKEEPDLFAAFQQIPEQSRDGAESEMNSVRQMVFNENKVDKEEIDFQTYILNGFVGTGDQSAKAFGQFTGSNTDSTALFLSTFDPATLSDPNAQAFMRQASSMPTFIKKSISQLTTGTIQDFPGGVNGALTMVNVAKNFTINADGTRRYKGLSADEAFFLDGFTNLVDKYGIARAAELHQDARKILSNDSEFVSVIRAQTESEGSSVYEMAKQSLIKNNPGINIADLEEFVYPYAKQLAIPGMDVDSAVETVSQIYEERHVEDAGAYLVLGRETVAYSPAYYFQDGSGTDRGLFTALLYPDKSRSSRHSKFNAHVQNTVQAKIKELPGGRFGTMPNFPTYGTDFFVKPNPGNDAQSGSFMVVNHEGSPVLDVSGNVIEITTKGAEKMLKMKANQALIAENLAFERKLQEAEVEREQLRRSLPQFTVAP